MSSAATSAPSKAVILTLSLPKGKDPRIPLGAPQALMWRLLQLFTLLTLALVLDVPHVHAQGCAQCLDSTRATPPGVQAAYRHAIYLLGGAGTAIFIAGVYLLRRNP